MPIFTESETGIFVCRIWVEELEPLKEVQKSEAHGEGETGGREAGLGHARVSREGRMPEATSHPDQTFCHFRSSHPKLYRQYHLCGRFSLCTLVHQRFLTHLLYLSGEH